MGGGTAGDEDLRSRDLWYGWGQNSLGIGSPLDAVSLENLGQRLATENTAAFGRRTRAPERSSA